MKNTVSILMATSPACLFWRIHRWPDDFQRFATLFTAYKWFTIGLDRLVHQRATAIQGLA